MYAGTSAGTYRKADEGLTWEPLSAGLPVDVRVAAFARVGESLFAGTGRSVYRSADGGQNWTAVNTGLASGPSTNARPVGVLASHGATLLAGTVEAEGIGGSIFRSADLGESWTEVRTGLPGVTRACTSFAVSGADVFAVVDSNVYLSADDGRIWAAAGLGEVITLSASEVGVFALKLTAVWRSTDRGGPGSASSKAPAVSPGPP